MQHVKQLEGCIKRCQDCMEDIAAAVDAFGGCIVDDARVLQLWRSRESNEAALIHALAVCDTSVHSHRFRVMYLLSHGNEVLAHMQLEKERLLICFRSIAAKRDRGVMATAMPTSGPDAAASAAIDQLVRESARLLCELRGREQHLVDHVLLILRELVCASRGEGDVMMELQQQEEDRGRGVTLESLLYILPSFPGDAGKKTHETAAVSRLKEDHDVVSCASAEDLNAIWTDLHLVEMSLQNAFAAAACKHQFVAAYDFALVMKLLVTKCYAVEELLMTALSLESRGEGEASSRHGVAGPEWTDRPTSPWIFSMLSKMHPDVLPKEAFVARDKSMPPYFISLAFASLVWNIAFCLWQKGCVKEAHQWLCDIDVERLFLLAAATEKEDAEEDMTDVCGLMTRHSFMEDGDRRLPETSAGQWGPRESQGVGGSGEAKGPRGDCQEPARLYPLLRRIASLRNLCAILLLCTTPQDVLFLLLHLQCSLRWKAQYGLRRIDRVSGVEDECGTGEPHTDAAAEVLTVVMLIVEYYLTQRAMVTVESSALSESSSPMTVDVAVHHVCDELICFLSSAKLSGVEDVEQHGIPPSWHVRYNHESDVRTDGSDAPLGPLWLTVQVIGMTQAFVSGFRSSTFYRSTFAFREPNAMDREAARSTMKPTEKRLKWPSSFVNTVQATARFIIKSVGSSWWEGEAAETERKSTLGGSDLHASPLVPQCFEVKEYLRAERGPGVLCFPSLHGVGLPLLPEEKVVVDGSCEGLDDVAWRLLIIACRYSNSQSLVSLVPHNSTGHSAGLLGFVIPELNNAARMLMTELNGHAGDEWLPVWNQKKSLSAGRARTSKLLAALERGAFSSVVQNDPRIDGAEGKACGKKGAHPGEESPHDPLLAGTSTAPGADAVEDAGKEWEEHAGGSVAGLWDFSPPTYTPPLHFDLSAFSSNSAEELQATRQLVDELPRGQGAADGAAANGDEATTGSGAHHMRVLTPKSRELLHGELPSIWQFMPWRLIYSSRLHGFSYSAMLSCSQREADASREHGRMPPMLLVIELMKPNRGASTSDEDGSPKLVIGACLSHPLHTGTRRFYGNNGTFVFQLLLPPVSQSAAPELRTYRATGTNQQFINTTSRTLAIGGGGGCSIFLNDTVTQGSTAACATFQAPPLTHWRTPSSCLSWSSDAAAEGTAEDDLKLSYAFDVSSLELIVVGNRRRP